MPLPSEQLVRLGITLPEPPRPVAAYVPFVRHGDLLLLSGQIAVRDGRVVYSGRVGDERTVADGAQAARLCAINALAVAADAAGGVDRLSRVLKVVVYVASHPDFREQHVVANGASELLGEVFGEAGRHARAAVGVASLPMNSAVEIDVTFAVS
jgi:enamine deaminase RidA (YjgF/YER057c/UK114 family)